MTMINPVSMSAPIATNAINSAQSTKARRKAFGEVVGNVFYGTLMKQMNESKLKGTYFHGGRGEEAFRGQLALELGKRMGQSPTDPLVNRMFAATEKRLLADSASNAAPVGPNGIAVPAAKSYPAEPSLPSAYPVPAEKVYPAGVDKEYPA